MTSTDINAQPLETIAAVSILTGFDFGENDTNVDLHLWLMYLEYLNWRLEVENEAHGLFIDFHENQNSTSPLNMYTTRISTTTYRRFLIYYMNPFLRGLFKWIYSIDLDIS